MEVYMSSVKPTGSGAPGGVEPPQETSVPPKTEDAKGAGGGPPSSEASEHTKSTKQLATSKKEEFGFSTISKTLSSTLETAKQIGAKVGKEMEIQGIAESAKKSGLEESETKKLTDRLHGMDDKKFAAESKFLKENVLNSPNADRALRTYNELGGMQDKHPARLKDKHIHVLTKGVAEPRTESYKLALGKYQVSIPTTTGKEGVLGQEGAKKAAEALIGMPRTDYKTIDRLLDQAGKKGKERVGGSNPDMERALILKAAGAHAEKLTHPSRADRANTLAGTPSSKMFEIAQYAKEIRGEKADKLAQQSTSIDPYWGNSALQQRWNDSCGPTTAQGMKAELDPIYAKKLHGDFIHDTNTKDKIGKEQKKVLEQHGGIAVKRDAAGGAGTYLDEVLNSQVKKYTGVTYAYNGIADTKADREAALDKVADKLKAGVDVPIRGEWSDGGGHFMYLTDVRGSGADQKFLLTDPWEGKTVWLTREQMASGKTPFPSGEGKFEAAYY
jgi:hypothetical protein